MQKLSKKTKTVQVVLPLVAYEKLLAKIGVIKISKAIRALIYNFVLAKKDEEFLKLLDKHEDIFKRLKDR